jgi:hypothetical protein
MKYETPELEVTKFDINVNIMDFDNIYDKETEPLTQPSSPDNGDGDLDIDF